ncbi:MAG: hypothetical protein ACKOCX_05440 [Planctomycetota bacterium]
MPDASMPSEHPPARPSRQQLVVPPKQSAWPVALGAVASAAAGFGLVFFLGIGRHAARDDHAVAARPAEAIVADEPAGALALEAGDAEPGLLPDQAADRTPPAVDRWSPRGGIEPSPAGERPADRYADRYPARPVSHDDAPEDADGEAEPARLSRFSSPDLPPLSDAAERPVAAEVDASEPVAADPEPQALEHDPDPAPGADAGTELPPPEATVQDPAAVTEEARSPRLQSATELPPSDMAAPSADVEPAPGAGPPPTDLGELQPAGPPPASAAAPPAAAEGSPPLTAATSPDDAAAPPTHAGDMPPLAAPPRQAFPVPEPLPSADAPRAIPAPPPAAPEALPAGLPPPAISPFAAAPPLGPPAGAAPSGGPAAGERLEAPPGIEGQGVPGPLQLEGLQTPQLAVEKRGPREIQVGKPARYEIIVRNVGTAIAHEVTLRDAVPRGTSLIATTPPAAPADDGSGSGGQLVWMLGDMHPGGEASVLMELMPEEEGEIGSVASVSFRADATLRSRSTKPDLAVECVEPKPVRIGGDVQVAITVSNPGSGTATGVVLEAFLPETVSHRAGPELEFDVGQLRPGESKTIELLLGTRGPGIQPARFVARADGGLEVDRPLPIPVTAPTLEVVIDMPARRFLQRPATCRISMTNAGTASARSIELAAQLPPGMKFVRANNAGWHDDRTNRVLWNLEELPAGEAGTVEVELMAVQPGEQRITAAARSTDGPSDQAMHVCQVEGLPALAFQVADSEDPIEVDGVTEYVVRVNNQGTKAASGVRLAANLLGDLEPVEAEGPGRHRVANLAVEFEPLAKLGPGEEVVYRIRARGRRAGHQRVQVQLTSDDNPAPITKEELTSVYDDR